MSSDVVKVLNLYLVSAPTVIAMCRQAWVDRQSLVTGSMQAKHMHPPQITPNAHLAAVDYPLLHHISLDYFTESFIYTASSDFHFPDRVD